MAPAAGNQSEKEGQRLRTDNRANNVPPVVPAIQDYCLGREEELLQLLREVLPYIKGGHWPPQNHHVRTLAARIEKQLGC
jgi:hypothetical protein